ncbi:hypothetical protein TcG_11550 [Trypanosoma cruzi]|nr:hypothetical protein TcG_11550 [Trypanosoma cruzi]
MSPRRSAMPPANPPAMHSRQIPHPLVVHHPTPSFHWSYERHRAHTPLRPSTACACGEDPEKAFHSLCAQSNGAAADARVPARATTARRSSHKSPPAAFCAKIK